MSKTSQRAWEPAAGPNLTWITDDLAVGGRFSPDHVAHLAGPLGVKAVVDLREEDRDDEELLVRHGITFLHLPTPDNHAVMAAMLENGVSFAAGHLDAGERVLIHCEHGIGRSATLALAVLVERGMEPLEALELAKTKRSLVSPSPAQFECWARWLGEFGESHRAGWAVPSFDAFAAIAYRHLR